MNISRNFKDGKQKYDGLYDWQVENSVSDDDPLFPIIAIVFAVVLALPEYFERLRQEDAKLIHAIQETRRAIEMSNEAALVAMHEALKAIEVASVSHRTDLYGVAVVGGLVATASFAMLILVLYVIVS